MVEEPLLWVKDLKKYFPVTKGLILMKTVGQVQAPQNQARRIVLGRIDDFPPSADKHRVALETTVPGEPFRFGPVRRRRGERHCDLRQQNRNQKAVHRSYCPQ